LGLDLTNLFSDDALGHLLKDEEALLDDNDALGVADNLLLFHNSDRALAEVRVVEVSFSVKVIETVEGRNSAVVVESGIPTDNKVSLSNGGRRDREGRKSDNESSSEFSEHDDLKSVEMD
jgi:hypothetical protein